MAPKKQKVAATAPASRRPGKPGPAKGKTHDGRPNRAQKSAAKSAAFRVGQAEAQRKAKEKITEVKTSIQEEVITERKIGRPPNPDYPWTDELGEQLFALLATGSTLRELAAIEGGPSLYQLVKWLADETHSFSRIHMRAKAMLVPIYEDDARVLTEKANHYEIVTERQVVTKDGDVVNVEERRIVDNVERSKLAFAGLQWTLGHLKPKKHGRQPDTGDGGKNEQLEGLFAALKAGPAA